MSEDLVPHENNHALDVAAYMRSIDALHDPVTRRDYFSHMGVEDFLDLTQRVASLVRTGDPNHLQHFDGDTVGLIGHEVPDQREKEGLLRETWYVARSFLLDNTIPDEDALDYAAVTVAGGLLYAHPFADGNGRTSRILSYMISRGNADEAELETILGKSGGGGAWQVAPLRIVAPSKREFKGPQPVGIEWEDSLAGEAEDALGGVIANSMYRDTVLRQFIEDNGAAVSASLDRTTRRVDDGSLVLDGEKFIADLANDPAAGMANSKQLMELLRVAKADYVRRFLAAMQSQKPVSLARPITSAMIERPDATSFQRGMREVVARELARRAVDGLVTPKDQHVIVHRAYSRLRHTKYVNY